MGMPRFFRLAKPRQFHYEPIYYDERKEKLQERINQIEHKMGVKLDDSYKRTLGKGSFTNYHLRKRKTKTYSTTRLVIILIFLLILSYLLLFF
jgi:hypothetical protein